MVGPAVPGSGRTIGATAAPYSGLGGGDGGVETGWSTGSEARPRSMALAMKARVDSYWTHLASPKSEQALRQAGVK